MKRRNCLLLVLFVCLGSAFGLPKELKKGMTLEEVTKVCNGKKAVPCSEGVDISYYIYPNIEDSMFPTVIGYFKSKESSEPCLAAVIELSKEIPTSEEGKEIIALFDEYLSILIKQYGKPEIKDGASWYVTTYDITDPNLLSSLDYDFLWLYSLKIGIRELSATWNFSDDYVKSIPELEYIALYAVPSEQEGMAQLKIEYVFTE